MKVLLGVSLIVGLISLGLCEQSYIQPFKVILKYIRYNAQAAYDFFQTV